MPRFFQSCGAQNPYNRIAFRGRENRVRTSRICRPAELARAWRAASMGSWLLSYQEVAKRLPGGQIVGQSAARQARNSLIGQGMSDGFSIPTVTAPAMR